MPSEPRRKPDDRDYTSPAVVDEHLKRLVAEGEPIKPGCPTCDEAIRRGLALPLSPSARAPS